jgi:hypothetical protein
MLVQLTPIPRLQPGIPVSAHGRCTALADELPINNACVLRCHQVAVRAHLNSPVNEQKRERR